ncbi:hypothetical protein AVEN_30412-1 [Araneus ventricosus]|uniref:Uncharacterized protein n=1 Tax=Araneus ventricosus TaxID=182803 RepID=A0A4Y2S8C8_ARAVE|nr:hypothetical protein AVEN_30412-1 [Araneus ventricosus]
MRRKSFLEVLLETNPMNPTLATNLVAILATLMTKRSFQKIQELWSYLYWKRKFREPSRDFYMMSHPGGKCIKINLLKRGNPALSAVQAGELIDIESY